MMKTTPTIINIPESLQEYYRGWNAFWANPGVFDSFETEEWKRGWWAASDMNIKYVANERIKGYDARMRGEALSLLESKHWQHGWKQADRSIELSKKSE